MAYMNYLISVGGYVIPLRYIRAQSYKVTLNSMDLDSTRNANGELVRNALAHQVPKVEFNLKMMTNSELEELMSNIRSKFNTPYERKVFASVYVPEINDYMNVDMYMPDPQFTIYNIVDGVVTYKETTLKFIGY